MTRGRQKRTSRRVRRAARPMMAEGLESRELMAIFTVTTTADSGAGSLREAINSANSTTGLDVVRFNIGSGGQQTIALTAALPAIAEQVTIEGPTVADPDTGAPRPQIVIDGANAGGTANGFEVLATGSNTTIRGLAINRFGGNGILLKGGQAHIEGNFIGLGIDGNTDAGNGRAGVAIDNASGITIGGTTVEARNYISGNNQEGITIGGLGSDPGTGNVVRGNYIGTNFGGVTAVANESTGVAISVGTGITVGGTAAGAGNVISGNGGSGVTFFSVLTKRNVIQGNLIGTTAAGDEALPNVGHGVFGIGNGTTIGGTTAAARNVISGNLATVGRVSSLAAVFVQGNLTEGAVQLGNVIQGNSIGVGLDGEALPNTGTNIRLFSNVNTVGGTSAAAGNIIANALADTFGQGAGIAVPGGSTGNLILGNQIYGNATLGIDLGDDRQVLVNDDGDGDSGANNGQNYPVITSVAAGGGVTVIRGSLNSLPSRVYTLQFFRNDAADPSGFGEGALPVGMTDVTTDADGNAAFELILTSELTGTLQLTSTATDKATGDTSEFSRAIELEILPASDLALTQTVSPDPVVVGQPVTFTLTVANPGPQPATNVRVVNTLPAGAQFVSATGGVQPVAGVVTFTVPTIAVGSSVQLTVTVRPTSVGTATNSARVSSDTIDPVPGNNETSQGVQVVPAPGQSVLSFGSATFDVAEADGTARINVTRSNGTGPLSVRLTSSDGTATVGEDYVGVDQILEFAEGELVKTIEITVHDDRAIEADETVFLTLSAPTDGAILGQPFTSVLSILNDDPTPPAAGRFRFGASTFSVVEGQRVLSIPIERVGGSTGEVSVDFITSDGTAQAGLDYIAQAFRITFSDGDSAPKFVQLQVLDDLLDEADETVNLTLANPVGGTLGGPSSSVVSILDDDATPPPPEQQVVTLSSASYAVSENAGVASITVTRNSAVGSVVVQVTTADGTARQNVRYIPVSATLTFAEGELSKTVDIPIINTELREGDETINVALSLPQGGTTLGSPSVAVVTIIDDEAAPPAPEPTPGSFAFTSSRYLVEETAGQAVFNIVRTGGTAGRVTVNVVSRSGTATPGVDYTPINIQVVFEDGQSLAEVRVPITDDSLVEGTEFVGLFLENATGGAVVGPLNSAVLEIADDDRDTVSPTVLSATLGGSGAVTSITVAFSEGMDLATVQNPSNYVIANLGRDGRAGTFDDRLIPVASATYDALTQSITLVPSTPLVANQTYGLAVLGTSTDAFGNLLDGDGDGQAGGHYFMQFSRAARHNYIDGNGDRVQLAMNGGGMIELVRTAAGDAQTVKIFNARPGRSILVGAVRRARTGDGLAQIGTLQGIDGLGVVRSRLTTPPFIIGSVSPVGVDTLLASTKKTRGR